MLDFGRYTNLLVEFLGSVSAVHKVTRNGHKPSTRRSFGRMAQCRAENTNTTAAKSFVNFGVLRRCEKVPLAFSREGQMVRISKAGRIERNHYAG